MAFVALAQTWVKSGLRVASAVRGFESEGRAVDGLEDLEVYRIAEELSDRVWEMVARWEWFPKRTVGVELVEAADSTAANVAEGHGRFACKENRRFCLYARGSHVETRNWLRRAAKGDLMNKDEKRQIRALVARLGPKVSAYIRSMGTPKTLKQGTPTNA